MTVALGNNIALPLSSALSYRLAFDTMGKLANYGKLGGTADPDAVIEALFASGEQGAWYDPSDLSTMFQDSAGTTPVTADGQPVGLILDKSGRGNHASQATAAKRPLYKTSGGLHWLQFDGVDDALATASIDFTSTDKMSVFSGSNRTSSTGDSILVELSSTVLAAPGAFATYSPVGSNDMGAYLRGTDGTFLYGTPVNNGTPYVGYLGFDIAGAARADEIKIRVNGVIPTITTGGNANAGTGNFGTYPMYIGARGGDSKYFNGKIYSIIVLGRTATTQEITDTETWVNSKTGAY
ncbi:MAG: hypothetical protein KBE22_03250 [Candidatus Accumulibacter sp.]|nr:hypothetical protein [Accumulibacter sp.]